MTTKQKDARRIKELSTIITRAVCSNYGTFTKEASEELRSLNEKYGWDWDAINCRWQKYES